MACRFVSDVFAIARSLIAILAPFISVVNDTVVVLPRRNSTFKNPVMENTKYRTHNARKKKAITINIKQFYVAQWPVSWQKPVASNQRAQDRDPPNNDER